MNPLGMLVQQEPGMPTQFWESIPIAAQVLVGGVVLAGAGWTWFLRPRMLGIMTEAVSGVSKEIADTREELRTEIAEKFGTVSKEIVNTREGLRMEIADTREALRMEIADTREGLRMEIADTREGLRTEFSTEIAKLRMENQEAHAVIGNRIDRLRDFVAQEIKEVRADIADMKAHTAKLAGAVDVLKSMVLRGDRPEAAAGR